MGKCGELEKARSGRWHWMCCQSAASCDIDKQAHREPQRGPGKHYRGALSPPSHSVCLDIETPKASRGRKRGEGCRLAIRLEVRGSVVSSPSGVRAEPRSKMDFMHILGQKEAIWNTIFSIFERRRGPQRSRGPGKRPSFPPSRRACKQVRKKLLSTTLLFLMIARRASSFLKRPGFKNYF